MSGVVANNFGMWWRRSIARPAVDLSPLVRERAALERLIATTDNSAIAELAKIRLKVVRFLSSGREASAEPSDADVNDGFDFSTLRLPETRSPTPASHLVEVSQKVMALGQLQSANEPRYDRLRGDEPVPLARFRLAAWPAELTANASRHVPVWLLIALAIGSTLFAFLKINASTGISHVLTRPVTPLTSADVAIFALWVLVLAFLLIRNWRVFYRTDWIGDSGIRMGEHFFDWIAIPEAWVTVGERAVRIEFWTHGGYRRVVVLDDLHLLPETWADVFAAHMMSRPVHPRLFVNGNLQVESKR